MSRSGVHSGQGPVLMVVLNLEFGGQEKMIVDLSRCLHSRGVSVTVCCLDNAGPLAERLREEEIPVIALEKGEGFSLSASRRLRKIILEQNISVVHSHNSPGLIYSALALFGIRRRKQITHINTRHGDVEIGPRGRFINRIANRGADGVVAVSDDLLRLLIEGERISTRKSRVIINGIDLEPFRDVPDLPSDGSFPVIAHVARLSGVKNQKMLLEVFSKLVAEFPSAKLLVIGDGTDREMLQQYAAECQVGDSAEFLGMREDIPKYLGMSHWFALTSLSEGTPMSVLEAMAAGRAITSTDVGGIPQVVEHGANGLLSPVGDVEEMLQNWLSLARSPEQAIRMGQAGQRVANERYSVEAMCDLYVNNCYRARE